MVRFWNLLKNSRFAYVFRTVIAAASNQFTRRCSTHRTRNPVSLDRLRLRGTLHKIGIEMRARLGRFSLPYLLKNWIITRAGGMVPAAVIIIGIARVNSAAASTTAL